MRSVCREQRWLGIVTDGSGATLYAVQGRPPRPTLAAIGQVRFEAEALAGRASLPELQRFVAEQKLKGCDAHLHLTGAGAVVHKLHIPVTVARHLAKAVRTRLMTYLGSRELCVDQRVDPHGRDDKNIDILAAGADADLVRGLSRALEKAGLRVHAVAALADACGAPAAEGRVVQVVLSERTTAIQLFDNGRLVFCRDVLFGPGDFVAAYQRPILALDGPLSLSREQAEQLVREVGVPVGREDTPFESVRPEQLWPLISPALQKLQGEIEQTLGQHWESGDTKASLCVLSLPKIPGLAEYLAAELGLQPLLSDEQVEACYIGALHGGCGPSAPLDLSPPEERFVKRMTRPALVAASCAFLIMLANAGAPRGARAERGRLKPLAASLHSQLERAGAELRAARQEHSALLEAFTKKARLTQALPPDVPAVAVCRALFATVPDRVELLDVKLDADSVPVRVELRAAYRGDSAAGAMAADWARQLAESDFCAEAEVISVKGSGRDRRATITVRASLR